MSDLQNYPNHTSFSEHEQSCPYDEDRWCGYTDAEVLAEMDTEALIQALADRGVLVKVGWCPRGDGHLDGPDPEYPSDGWGECGSKWIAEAWMTRWKEDGEC